MPKAWIKDITLNYETTGSGSPILLIMGYTGNLTWWPQEFTNQLSKQFHVITFDNRGAGQSQRGKSPYSIQLLAEDAVNLLDHLGIAQTDVLGVSMGGMIAQEIALRHPKRVDRLILACTTSQAKVTSFLSKNTIMLGKSYLSDAKTRTRPLMSNMIFDQGFLNRAPQEKTDSIIAALSENPMDPLMKATQLKAIAKFKTTNRLHQLQSETLVITGTKDSMINPKASKVLAKKITKSKLELLKDHGHGFIFENPQHSARVVKEFLRRKQNR